MFSARSKLPTVGTALKVQAVGREFAAGYGAAEHADAEGLRGWKTSEDDPKKIWTDVSERVDEIGSVRSPRPSHLYRSTAGSLSSDFPRGYAQGHPPGGFACYQGKL